MSKETAIATSIPVKPNKCWRCGSVNFWLRTAYGNPAWICNICHPNPNEEKK